MEYDREIAGERVEASYGNIELVRIELVRRGRDQRDHSAHEVRRDGKVIEVQYQDGSGTFEAAWDSDQGASDAFAFYYGMLAALSA